MRTLESLEIIGLMTEEPIIESAISNTRRTEPPDDTTQATKPERVRTHQEEIAKVANELGRSAKVFTGDRGISAILTTTSSMQNNESPTQTPKQEDQNHSLDYLVKIHSTPNQDAESAPDEELLKRLEAVNVANRTGKPIVRTLPDGRTLITKPSNPFKT